MSKYILDPRVIVGILIIMFVFLVGLVAGASLFVSRGTALPDTKYPKGDEYLRQNEYSQLDEKIGQALLCIVSLDNLSTVISDTDIMHQESVDTAYSTITSFRQICTKFNNTKLQHVANNSLDAVLEQITEESLFISNALTLSLDACVAGKYDECDKYMEIAQNQMILLNAIIYYDFLGVLMELVK